MKYYHTIPYTRHPFDVWCRLRSRRSPCDFDQEILKPSCNEPNLELFEFPRIHTMLLSTTTISFVDNREWWILNSNSICHLQLGNYISTNITDRNIFFFWKEDFIRKSTKNKNYAIYKIYTYMYIPPPAVYTNTIHNT